MHGCRGSIEAQDVSVKIKIAGGIQMQTTMKKRLFTLAITVVMMMTMAAPAFADWTLQPDSMTTFSNNYLNISRPDRNTNMKGRILTLYRTSNPGFDQHFTVQYSTYNGRNCTYFTRTENGVVYAINRSSSSYSYGPKAIMWTLSDGTADSAFKRPTSDPNDLLNLLNYSQGMHYTADAPGALVYFADGKSGNWFASGSPSI